jgi:hypothetical protein
MAIVYSFEPFLSIVKIIARNLSREGPCAKEERGCPAFAKPCTPHHVSLVNLDQHSDSFRGRD